MSASADEVVVTIESLAKWLAWSDRATSVTASVTRFSAGADRYWEFITPQYRGIWIAFASSIVGRTPVREVRMGFGLDPVGLSAE